MRKTYLLFIAFSLLLNTAGAHCVPHSYLQVRESVWCPNNGDGTYTNPVLYADYSDPDVCAVGEDYYLTDSSFNCIPGLPILHSKDLVNWTIIGHALQELEPKEVFDKPHILSTTCLSNSFCSIFISLSNLGANIQRIIDACKYKAQKLFLFLQNCQNKHMFMPLFLQKCKNKHHLRNRMAYFYRKE